MAISPWASSYSHCSLLAGWHFGTLQWLFPSCPHLCSDCHPHCVLPVSCKDATGLRISAKTVGISNNTVQFISNLLHSVLTWFHHSVTNSNELRFSTGWKRTDTPLNPIMIWVIEHSQHLPDSYPFYPAGQLLKKFQCDSALKTCSNYLSTIKQYHHVEQSELSTAFFF